MAASPPSDTAIRYVLPTNWIRYDRDRVYGDLVEAKAGILSLSSIPYQRDWVESLQALQLKMEVAGTSQIEGAEFRGDELDVAVDLATSSQDLLTKSQRQARAAMETYRWIATLPDDMPVSEDLICSIHRHMVTGCDDDHCPPGRLRGPEQNVTFGLPRHRGSTGGAECQKALAGLVRAMATVFRDHDPLIQAMALHYHFAAMHPFLDGNGRSARALEALLLQRAGLRETAFIAMSNYYYDEKPRYLQVLSEVRQDGHDLTSFLRFALRGVKVQCERLFREIAVGVKKAMFRNIMYDLFSRLRSPRKRVIAQRQIEILKVLLDGPQDINRMHRRFVPTLYSPKLKNPVEAFYRDLSALVHLGAILVTPNRAFGVEANLDWPSQITESDFMARVKSFPKSKDHGFLSFS